GLTCLHVFLDGDKKRYEELKPYAMRLGAAFQKVNFLRDLKADYDGLERTYFPNTNLLELDEVSKSQIVAEIEADFRKGYEGILRLPSESKFGVYMAYRYYNKLLNKLRKLPSVEIKNSRVRVPNYQKVGLLARSYVRYRLNLV
ncbi:MAG: phytoene/squalene synthase family protein, partial [Robiginitalea sp.]